MPLPDALTFRNWSPSCGRHYPQKGLYTAIVAGFLISLLDALRQMIQRCRRHDTRVILSGLRRQPSAILA